MGDSTRKPRLDPCSRPKKSKNCLASRPEGLGSGGATRRGDKDGDLTLSLNRSAAGRPIIKMPMAMESPRWSAIIVMEEVGCWSTYKMPMPMESPRLSFTIIMEEVGCLSTYKMPVPMEIPRWAQLYIHTHIYIHL